MFTVTVPANNKSYLKGPIKYGIIAVRFFAIYLLSYQL